MNDQRWIQHKSGQGTMYRLHPIQISDREFKVMDGYIFPTSEYKECASPSFFWKDITHDCSCIDFNRNIGGIVRIGESEMIARVVREGYRVSLVNFSHADFLLNPADRFAFIVEEKQKS